MKCKLSKLDLGNPHNPPGQIAFVYTCLFYIQLSSYLLRLEKSIFSIAKFMFSWLNHQCSLFNSVKTFFAVKSYFLVGEIQLFAGKSTIWMLQSRCSMVKSLYGASSLIYFPSWALKFQAPAGASEFWDPAVPVRGCTGKWLVPLLRVVMSDRGLFAWSNDSGSCMWISNGR